MVSTVHVLLLVFSVAVGAPEKDTGKVAFEFVAVKATKESREDPYFDAKLNTYKDDLKNLEFDTYRYLKSLKLPPADYGQPVRFGIDEQYTLHVVATEKMDDGRIKVEARVEAKPKDKDKKPVNVLKTTTMVVPGDKFRLGGPKLDEGQLVIVTLVRE